jgi:hypothetical protein
VHPEPHEAILGPAPNATRWPLQPPRQRSAYRRSYRVRSGERLLGKPDDEVAIIKAALEQVSVECDLIKGREYAKLAGFITLATQLTLALALDPGSTDMYAILASLDQLPDQPATD